MRIDLAHWACIGKAHILVECWASQKAFRQRLITEES
jgi:hypothetical protein